MDQIDIKTGYQALALAEFIRDNVAPTIEDEVTITQQGNGEIFVGTGLASATIAPSGDVDEN